MTENEKQQQKQEAQTCEANQAESACNETTCEDDMCNQAKDDASQQTNDSKQDKTTELTVTLQRLQAEFENFKKRSEKEKAQFVRFANKQLLTQLLPVLENFERALETTKDEGVTLIHKQFEDVLKNQGLQEIPCEGKFDPHMHEALLQEESDKEPGTILQVLQKGYTLHDAVLRPARVKISKTKA